MYLVVFNLFVAISEPGPFSSLHSRLKYSLLPSLTDGILHDGTLAESMLFRAFSYPVVGSDWIELGQPSECTRGLCFHIVQFYEL